MSDEDPAPRDVEQVRRTALALERTQLAWWRTGLTALAVGIGVGQVVPELDDRSSGPYVVAGAGFALYGVALFAYGSIRERALASQLASGSSRLEPSTLGYVLGAIGVVLGLATALLIILG